MAGRTHSLLDRIVSLFAKTKSGEGLSALALSANVFLLLSAYYLIKPVREALILSSGGAELKSYASVGQMLLLAGIVPVYAAIASRVSTKRLIISSTVFFQACLLLFWAASKLAVPHLGVAFFLFVGVFNLMIVAQFWSFAADVYSREQGERLFAVVAAGASLGAVVGSWLTGQLVQAFGVFFMLPLCAAFLGGALSITLWVMSRRESFRAADAPVIPEPASAEEARESAEKENAKGSFRLVLQSNYLIWMAVMMFLANFVNTTGEFILGEAVTRHAGELFEAGKIDSIKVWIGAFYSDFFFWVNIVAVTGQLFFVSRIISGVGVGRAIFILPIIALLSYGTLIAIPVLAVVRWVKTAENATDYSLNNTVRNALFLPLSKAEKYQAKQAIDTFFVRGGDVASALLVFVGLNVLSFGLTAFAMTNFVLALVWLFAAWKVGRGYAAH